jgi:hypothetical protein
VRQLVTRIEIHRIQPARLHRLDVLVERINEHPERQLALELGRAPRKHKPALRVRARLQLGQQPSLADARLARQQQRARTSAPELGERLIEQLQLSSAPDEPISGLKHPCGRA